MESVFIKCIIRIDILLFEVIFVVEESESEGIERVVVVFLRSFRGEERFGFRVFNITLVYRFFGGRFFLVEDIVGVNR